MKKTLKNFSSFAFALIEFLLIARFIMKLLAANTNTPFVAWIYDNTGVLLEPFRFAFPSPALKGGYEIEFTTLFAIFAYAFLGYIVQEAIGIFVKK